MLLSGLLASILLFLPLGVGANTYANDSTEPVQKVTEAAILAPGEWIIEEAPYNGVIDGIHPNNIAADSATFSININEEKSFGNIYFGVMHEAEYYWDDILENVIIVKDERIIPSIEFREGVKYQKYSMGDVNWEGAQRLQSNHFEYTFTGLEPNTTYIVGLEAAKYRLSVREEPIADTSYLKFRTKDVSEATPEEQEDDQEVSIPDYEKNISEFLNNKDKAYKVNELISDPVLLQDVMSNMEIPSPETEITWNELNTINSPNEYGYLRTFFGSPGIKDMSGLRIFKGIKLNAINIDGGKFSSIDLKNIEFYYLRITNTPIESLDLTENKSLLTVTAKNTNLKELYFNKQKVRALELVNNKLKTLSFINTINMDELDFLNVDQNYINIHSEVNKPIHEQLVSKLGDKPEYHAEGRLGYSYFNQNVKLIKIGGKEVDVLEEGSVSIEGTKSSVIFPDDIPEGTTFDAALISVKDIEKLTKDKKLVPAGDVFDFTLNVPEGKSFQDTFTLILNYDKEKFSKQEIAIYHFNEEKAEWELIGGVVDEKNGTISAEVNHFSIYGVLGTNQDGEPADNGNDSSVNIPDNSQTDDSNGKEESTSNDNANVKEGTTSTNSNNEGTTETTENISTNKSNDDQSGNELPNTATSMFNLIVFGVLLVILGGILVFVPWGRFSWYNIGS